MRFCESCGHELPDQSRFCTRCGKAVTSSSRSNAEEMNMTSLYVMVGLLILAVVIPPWEAPPGQPPEFLGFRLILDPPEPDAVVSRLLLTVELFTIAVAGVYFSWLFRRRGDG
jgi:predicted nucleic acid-binding Zn ribbon protein